MTTFIKIFAKVFGYDYQVLMDQPTISRQKVVTLGTLLMIPVFLWTVSGFYISYTLLGAGMMTSLVVGAVLGAMILVVDRSFISSPKSSAAKLMKTVRIGFALISTVLGSLALDLMLFGGDLQEFRASKGEAEKVAYTDQFRKEQGAEVKRLLEEKVAAEARFTDYTLMHFHELDGSGGTGKYGSGKVADAKEKEKERALVQFEKAEEKYQKALEDLEERAMAFGEMMSAKRSDALMSQIKDLHEFVFSDPMSKGVYFFFMAFVFLLEISFLLFKSFAAETIYESYLYAEEEIGRQKLDSFRADKTKLMAQRSLLGEDHDRIVQSIGSKGYRKII